MALSSIEFLVQGSAASPYKVTFTFNGEGNLNAFCSCPAGEKGQYCKHRMSILRREDNAIVSNNRNELSTVIEWLAGSDVELAIHDIAEAEYELGEAQKKLKKAKKDLAIAMRN